MSKAYDHGARKLWILNVGDLKPGEIGTEFFMQMAWNIGQWRRDNLPTFLQEWARREFGASHAAEIAAVMDQYYRLAFARKPEHLQWNLPGEPSRLSELTQVDYGDELQTRLDAYEDLESRADLLYALIPARLRDAFYELVVYPVRGSMLANRRFFLMEKSGLYAEQGRKSAINLAREATDASALIKAETDYYNERLAGGRWRNMMSMEMKPGQWTSMRTTPPDAPPLLSSLKFPEKARLGVAIEGERKPVTAEQSDASLPTFSVFTHDTRFIDVFNTGLGDGRWAAKPSHNWIKLSRASGSLSNDGRIQVSIDWTRAPKGNDVAGTVAISGAGARRVVQVRVFNPPAPRVGELEGFVESDGAVSIEAEHFTAKSDQAGVSWKVIPGLGRTGDSVAIFPTTTKSVEPALVAGTAPRLDYRLYLFHPGTVVVTCYLVPTQPLQPGRGLRYAIAVDDEPPQMVTVGADLEVSSRPWSLNVLNAMTKGESTHQITNAGTHTLRIYMVDAGVVFDKIVMDVGGARRSYLGPKETRVISASPR